MTQQQLADAAGTNANMIGYLEAGERALSLKWARRLAPALDTNEGMLIQYDPNDLDDDLIEIWATASNRERKQLLDIARTIVRKTGTD